MQSTRIKQADAFTRTPFTGNPAGVVLDADGLNKSEMQKIANEMNLSETCFVMKPESEKCDLRLRWFTPKQEVDLCGHATIAAFHAIAEEGRYGLQVDEPQSFLVETKSGQLTVDVEWMDLKPYVKFSLPVPKFFPFPDDIGVLCGAIGLSEIELSQKVKPQITGQGYCFVPLKNYDSLKTIEPNFSLLRKLNDRHDLCGFAVATTDSGDREHDWHMRFFAPSLGVDEDPVTGSANGPMGVFLHENGFLDPNQSYHTLKGAQGRFLNRPGLVYVTMSVENDQVKELQIGGHAVTVMEGSIFSRKNIPENF